MKKIKIFGIVIFLIILSSFVFADDSCIKDDVCNLKGEIRQDGLFLDVDNATITLYNESHVLLNNETATEYSIGRFYYNYIFNETGEYESNYYFYKDSELIGYDSEIISITNYAIDDYELEIGGCPSNKNIALFYLIIGVSLIFILFGYFMSPIMGILGTFMLMIASFYITACLSIFSYILGAVAIITFIYFVFKEY